MNILDTHKNGFRAFPQQLVLPIEFSFRGVDDKVIGIPNGTCFKS